MKLCMVCRERPALDEEEPLLGACEECQEKVDVAVQECLAVRFKGQLVGRPNRSKGGD